MSYEAQTNSKSLSRLSPDLLDTNQQEAVTALYEGNRLIVAKMGAGKTVVAATAITELLADSVVERVLIVSTPKIANTVWRQEFNKWQHTHKTTVEAATGQPDEREKIIKSGVQVVVVTFNVLPWMKQKGLLKYFDGLLIDETTKLKTTGGAQFKAIRHQLKHFTWRAGLTGTPVSEDFEGLFGQMMLIDCGQALGRNKESFLNRYFIPTDFKRYNWILKPNADSEILKAISHLVHSIPDYRGELKEPLYRVHSVVLPDHLRSYYETMKKDMVTDDAVSQTAAVLSQKLQQIAAGFVYLEDGEAKSLSDYRVEEMATLMQSYEHTNVLVCYWYKEDLQRLTDRFPNAEVLDKKRLNEQVAAWNAGKIKMLLIHPRSAGHGLQLEQGGHTIIWYSPQWSNDLWEQTNARLWRKGQKERVEVISIEAQDTVDELINARIESKAQFDALFHKHLGEN